MSLLLAWLLTLAACFLDPSPAAGPGSHYPVKYSFCRDNYSNPGYAQTLPLLDLAQSQGNAVQSDKQQGANFVGYYNKTDKSFHQVWFDDPATLALKYKWAAESGLGGTGMWTPSATLFNEGASRAMWAAVPTRAEAAALRAAHSRNVKMAPTLQ